jgi:hypothetical protein
MVISMDKQRQLLGIPLEKLDRLWMSPPGIQWNSSKSNMIAVCAGMLR